MSLEKISEEKLREMFDDVLDEMRPKVELFGYDFQASRILRELDPIAYECELRNYADSIRDEYIVKGWND
jgi:hypothetical protein